MKRCTTVYYLYPHQFAYSTFHNLSLCEPEKKRAKWFEIVRERHPEINAATMNDWWKQLTTKGSIG